MASISLRLLRFPAVLLILTAVHAYSQNSASSKAAGANGSQNSASQNSGAKSTGDSDKSTGANSGSSSNGSGHDNGNSNSNSKANADDSGSSSKAGPSSGGSSNSNGSATANGKGNASGGQSTTGSKAEKNADDDWVGLTLLATPVASSTSRASKTTDQRDADRAQQVAQSRQAAQAAKDFYTQHPTDPRATEARKTEAMASLHGVQDNDAAQELSAVAVAQVFRSDRTVPANDRFEVAQAMDQQELSIRRQIHAATNTAAEEKKLADNWRAEFGALPEIDTFAASVARRADPATAAAIAGQLMHSPVAPTEAKAEAQSILERSAQLGQKLELKLSLADGGELDLAQLQGKVTLLIAWPATQPDTLQTLVRYVKAVPKQAQVIYLGMGGTKAQVTRLKNALPIPGQSCYAATGPAMNATAVALKLRTLPCVYVLNRAGLLSDFGPLTEFPAILARATGQTIGPKLLSN